MMPSVITQMRGLVGVGAVAAMMSLLAPQDATAALVSLDSVWGTDTVTLDTVTNLQWLDVPLTVGLSINQVTALLQPGATYDGFRYASGAEIKTLFFNAGLGSTELYLDRNPSYLLPAQTLLALLGQTGSQSSPGGSMPFVIGWQSDTTGFAGTGFNYSAALAIQPPSSGDFGVCQPSGCVTALAQSTGHYPGDGSIASPTTGSFLVRSNPVSEPGVIGLLCMGLAAVMLLRRRENSPG